MNTLNTSTPGRKSSPGVSTRINQLARQVPIAYIVRIQAIGSRCWLFTHDGGQHMIPHSLASIGQLVGSFWRVHKAHLVNPEYVMASPGLVRNQSRLRLKTGDFIPVARRRKEHVYQCLRQLQS